MFNTMTKEKNIINTITHSFIEFISLCKAKYSSSGNSLLKSCLFPCTVTNIYFCVITFLIQNKLTFFCEVNIHSQLNKI